MIDTGGITETQAILLGFLVWLMVAPRPGQEQYPQMFAAYMVALALSLIGTENLWATMPIAFYFTIGGAFAFLYLFCTRMVVIRVRKK